MDCCGSGRSKEDKDVKAGNENNQLQKGTGEKASNEGHGNDPAIKSQDHGGGCCGGGGAGMWLHLIIMLVVFVAIWYLGRTR